MFAYNELVKNWDEHTKTVIPVVQNHSLNNIQFPSKGRGSSKGKTVFTEIGDNSDHIARREAKARRAAWDMRKDVFPTNATYEQAENSFFVCFPCRAVPPDSHPSHQEARPLLVDSGASQHMICSTSMN